MDPIFVFLAILVPIALLISKYANETGSIITYAFYEKLGDIIQDFFNDFARKLFMLAAFILLVVVIIV